jgi:PAS domain S-box-containing protein
MGTTLDVLILEDQEPDAELMADELRRAGFEPMVLRVDNEADFQLALERGPDVILADYHLPRFNASEALAQVRDKKLDIPFIVVSGAVSEDVAVECMKRGAADYVLKDRLTRLGQAVRQALEARRSRERARVAADALRISEARYRSLTDDVLDNSAVGIFILDADLTVVWANKAVQKFFGVPREAMLGKEQRWLVQHQLAAATEQPGAFARALFATYDDNTYTESFECHVLPSPAGGGALARRERWLEHLSHPIAAGIYKDGRIEHYTDITERKAAEQRRDQLVAQQDQRVRDTIHDVTAAAERALHGSSSMDDFKTRFMERLRAIGRMHELLAEARSRGADVRELVSRTLAAATADPQGSTIAGEEVRLPGPTVTPLGLALHDLAAGAISRGVLAGPEGHVEVKWDRRRSPEGNDVLHLVWEEVGKAAEAKAVADEVRSRVAQELSGEVNLKKGDGRAVFEIVVPLGRDKSGAGV